jgi:hypothetical protein
MKPFPFMALVLFLALPCRAEDWTVKDKTYHGVTVTQVDADSVSIMYDDGIAHINWTDLPADVQKKLSQQHDSLVADIKAKQDADAAAAAAQQKAEADILRQQEETQKKAQSDFDSLEKTTITGQVFIVTKGGDNVKLGSIHVYLYSEDEINAAINPLVAKALDAVQQISPTMNEEHDTCKQLKEQLDDYTIKGAPAGFNVDAFGKKAENAFAQYRATLTSYYNYFSQSYYTDALPTALTEAQSDADGKFTIQIPKTGLWVLGAEGQRTVGNDTEEYLWLTKVKRDAVDKNQLFLNNENLSTSDSSDSIVKTMDTSERQEIIDTADYLVSKDDSN